MFEREKKAIKDIWKPSKMEEKIRKCMKKVGRILRNNKSKIILTCLLIFLYSWSFGLMYPRERWQVVPLLNMCWDPSQSILTFLISWLSIFRQRSLALSLNCKFVQCILKCIWVSLNLLRSEEGNQLAGKPEGDRVLGQPGCTHGPLGRMNKLKNQNIDNKQTLSKSKLM